MLADRRPDRQALTLPLNRVNSTLLDLERNAAAYDAPERRTAQLERLLAQDWWAVPMEAEETS